MIKLLKAAYKGICEDRNKDKLIDLTPAGIELLNPPKDIEQEALEILIKCAPYTMTSLARMYSMYQATKYIIENNIPGDIVECGVLRGGSCMISTLTLLKYNDTSRKIYLYDTYTGMPEAGKEDITTDNLRPLNIDRRKKNKRKKVPTYLTAADVDTVKKNVCSTGYPQENFVFVKGLVEDTIPGTSPKNIALLRLDTDYYSSTDHELRHLYPRLVKNGVLIIDDYGYWRGSKKAVDQYLAANNIHALLNRIDETGRLVIKN